MRRSLLVLCVALAGMMLAAPVSPALAAQEDVEPMVTCVWKNTDGSLTASFGYTNTTGSQQTIAISGQNKVTPDGLYQGQPTTFAVGTVTNAFTVTWASGDLSWKLGTVSVTASSTSTKCAAKPVSMLGSFRALGVGLLALVGLGVLVLRRRPDLLRRMG